MTFSDDIKRLEQLLVGSLGDAVETARRSVGDQLRRLGGEIRSQSRAQAYELLRDATRELAGARSQAELLSALTEQAGRFASRSGLLLTTPGGARGWASYGFGEAGGAFAELSLDYDREPWSALAAGRGFVHLTGGDAAALSEHLAAAPPEEALLVPLVLRDRVAACLYADRLGESDAFSPEALQLLAFTAAALVEGLAFRSHAAAPTLQPHDAASDGLPLWEEPAAAAAAEVAPPAAPPAAAEEAPTAEPAAIAPTAEDDLWSVEEEPAAQPDAEQPVHEQAEPPAQEPQPEEPAAGEPPPEDAEIGAAEETPAAEEAAEPLPEPEVDDLGFTTEEGPLAYDSFEEPTESLTGPIDLPAAGDVGPPEEVPTAATGWRPPAEEPAAAEPAPPEVPSDELFAAEPATAGEPTAPTAEADEGEAGIEGDGTEDRTVMLDRSQLPAPPPAAPAPAAGRAEGGVDGSTQVQPPADLEGPGWAFRNEPQETPVFADEETAALHEEAKRLARLLVSEIKLYNEEQVEEGRRHRDVYRRLQDDIDRSRQMYNDRVDPSVRTETDYFQQELVNILAAGDADALGM